MFFYMFCNVFVSRENHLTTHLGIHPVVDYVCIIFTKLIIVSVFQLNVNVSFIIHDFVNVEA